MGVNNTPSTATNLPMNTGDLLVEAHNISVRDGARALVHNIDIALRSGEIVTLIGPNGAGKTTLLKALLGLIPLASGTVVRAKNLRVGYMPQRLHLNPLLPITVMRFLQQTGENDAAIAQALAETGISSLQKQSLHSASGGELQRVLLAHALLRKPQWLVLDEPAQGVDINGQAELYRLISKLRSRYHCGVLLVSHDLHLVMAATDTVICLNQHICCQGRPEHVNQHPEYLHLFGKKTADDITNQMGVYTHHHDHNHDLQGNIIVKNMPTNCPDHHHD